METIEEAIKMARTTIQRMTPDEKARARRKLETKLGLKVISTKPN